MSSKPTPTKVAAELIQLHAIKDPKYKDAWRKRGELVGIFCNIARKYDRLVVAQGEADPDTTEARADTAADLCIYAVKYVTWLIEHDPDAAEAIAGADPVHWSGIHGHTAVTDALEQLAEAHRLEPTSLAEAFEAVSAPFAALERILVDQEDRSAGEKAALAWSLADGALAYLWRLAVEEPQTWEGFAAYVANAA
jgi:hypothetical protein